jgi:hypothetical protein
MGQDFVHSIDCLLRYWLIAMVACDGDGDGLEWSPMGGCQNGQ